VLAGVAERLEGVARQERIARLDSREATVVRQGLDTPRGDLGCPAVLIGIGRVAEADDSLSWPGRPPGSLVGEVFVETVPEGVAIQQVRPF